MTIDVRTIEEQEDKKSETIAEKSNIEPDEISAAPSPENSENDR